MEIIYPMFALILLTFIVVLALGVSQFIGVKKGQFDPRYLKLISGYEIPDGIIKLRRNFANLLELPILFYILCITLLVLNIESQLMTVLAWIFVVLRVFHSVIHISYNHPLHRFFPFFISTCILIFMWVKLIFLVT